MLVSSGVCVCVGGGGGGADIFLSRRIRKGKVYICGYFYLWHRF